MRMGYGPLVGVVVVVGLIIGISFGSGVVLGQKTAGTPTSTAAAGGGGAGGAPGGGGAGAGGAGAAAGAGGAGGQASGGGQAGVLAGQTIGVIDSVQGDGIALRGLDGATTQLATTASTGITNSVPGSVADLRTGALIAVNPGPPDARGRTTARTILVLPPQLAGGAGGGGSPRPSATPPR